MCLFLFKQLMYLLIPSGMSTLSNKRFSVLNLINVLPLRKNSKSLAIMNECGFGLKEDSTSSTDKINLSDLLAQQREHRTCDSVVTGLLLWQAVIVKMSLTNSLYTYNKLRLQGIYFNVQFFLYYGSLLQYENIKSCLQQTVCHGSNTVTFTATFKPNPLNYACA